MSPAAVVLRGTIRVYQGWSARRPPNCRFEPSCSQYAFDAITAYGATRGAWLATRRILRCRPGGGFGWDPVSSPESRASRAGGSLTSSSEAHGVQ